MNEISYVIPTLNSAATLDLTLLSLRSQKNAKVNIIVVDSGSTDSTLDICQRWDAKTLYAEPGNMYRAINAGLQQCATEWVGYINSDDWLYQDSISRLLEKAKADNADVVYGNCDYTDIYGRFVYSFAALEPNKLLSLFKMGAFGFAQPAAIFRHRAYQQLNGFDESYRFSADADFYLRMLKSGFCFAMLSGAPVACFRVHNQQLSNSHAEAMGEEMKRIFATDSKNLADRLVWWQWRSQNMPHYLIRLLRQSLLSGRMKVTKSMESYLPEAK